VCAGNRHTNPAIAVGSPVMPRTGLRQCGINTGLDAAFGLAAHGG